jgi:hypothetical protein
METMVPKGPRFLVEESFWQPPAKAIPDDEIVGLRVGLREMAYFSRGRDLASQVAKRLEFLLLQNCA